MYKELIQKLNKNRTLSEDEYLKLVGIPEDQRDYLFETARNVRLESFGNGVYMRGLIELTNYCMNDCYYCGIRRSNDNLERYRLTKEDVLDCCDIGSELGFKTFVIQGGEDPFYTADIIADMVRCIKRKYPDTALTLSLGEADPVSYRKWFDAGADRYLLRHETATDEHYKKLHPKEMLLSDRLNCLNTLKAVGFQTGTGFMVGSPYQTDGDLVRDLMFIENFEAEMVGIGPFISHHDTEFAGFENGSVEKTLTLIAILRLMDPNVLLPATTALGSASEDGRERGILVGANVVMPNITPQRLRKLYSIYDNKINTGADTAEGMELLKERIEKIGYKLLSERGDYRKNK